MPGRKKKKERKSCLRLFLFSAFLFKINGIFSLKAIDNEKKIMYNVIEKMYMR